MNIKNDIVTTKINGYLDLINSGKNVDLEQFLVDCNIEEKKHLLKLINLVDLLQKYYSKKGTEKPRGKMNLSFIGRLQEEKVNDELYMA